MKSCDRQGRVWNHTKEPAKEKPPSGYAKLRIHIPDIVTRLHKWESARSLAKEYGCSETAIQRIARTNNIDLMRNRNLRMKHRRTQGAKTKEGT